MPLCATVERLVIWSIDRMLPGRKSQARKTPCPPFRCGLPMHPDYRHTLADLDHLIAVFLAASVADKSNRQRNFLFEKIAFPGFAQLRSKNRAEKQDRSIAGFGSLAHDQDNK